MALPPFADTDDLAARLPAGVVVDDTRAEAALDDASALIHMESNEAWVEDGALIADVPAIAKMVCCKAAIRALVNPSQMQQQATGPFSSSFGDVYLTTRERDMLRQAAGGTSGLWTLATTRLDTYEGGDFTVYDGTVYIDVVDQDEPIPFVDVPWPLESG